MNAYAVFGSGKKLGGWLIKAIEKIGFSHCAIWIEDRYGNYDVYESVWPRSRCVDLETWHGSYRVNELYKFPIRDHVEYMEMKFFLGQKTKKWYSISQLVYIGFTILFPTYKWNNKVINGSRNLICTELVGDFFERFYGCKWNETTDTISLVETRNEIKRKWLEYGNVSGS